MELLQNLMSTNTASEKEVNDSITTLVDRLTHSTLLLDRRAAVLGLKSFSRQYRETVVEKSLKNLVATLHKDSIDQDSVKAILETLLVLFIRGEGDQDLTRDWISQQSRLKNGKYPSPSLLVNATADQFSLWISDELTQSVKNIDLLVNFLETEDMHIKLYTLQLLQALCTTRPIRTKELILKSPLAVSKLCSTLDDSYEPIRNEAILLLMGVVKDNFNIQKLVAFENTFDRLYKIVDEEGGIEGNIVVQDCLSLVTNLLRYNASNQKFFLETNCMKKLAELINQPLQESEFGPIVWNEQRMQNLITTMDTCRLFVLEGSDAIQRAQQALVDSDILMLVLKLVFSLSTPNNIRVNALLTTADIIRGNQEIQLQFSQIDVPYLDPSLPATAQKFDEIVPTISAILNWCLYVNSVHLFDLRMAASTVLHAYFKNNEEAKFFFIKDQKYSFNKMNGISSSDNEGDSEIEEEDDDEPFQNGTSKENGKYETEENGNVQLESSRLSTPSSSSSSSNIPGANLFQTLVNVDNEMQLNPYKVWFTAVTFLYIFEDYPEGKELALKIKIGDETADEDVLTIIEAVGQALCSALRFQDPRAPVAYLMLLISWVWEDFEAVDMFLHDPSILDQLLAYLAETSYENILVQGMITILLGSVYEFTRKQSPISRVQLNTLLRSRIGENAYSLKVQQFQQTPAFASFDPQSVFNPERDDTGLPQVYFDSLFVTLVKENFFRLSGAIGHDPNIEPVRSLNYVHYLKSLDEYSELADNFGTFKKESEELSTKQMAEIQKLVSDYDELSKNYEETNKQLEALRSTHEQLDGNFSRSSGEVQNLKAIKKDLESQLSTLHKQFQEATSKMTALEASNKQLEDNLTAIDQKKSKAEDGINKMSRELMQLTREKDAHERTIKNMEKDAAKITKTHEKIENQLKAVIKLKEDAVIELETKVNGLATEIRNKDNNYSSLKNTHEKTLESLKAAESHSESLMGNLRQAAEFIEKLKTEKDSISSEIDSITKMTNEELEKVKSELASLQSDKKELAAKNEKLATDLSELQDELIEAQEEYETLQSETAAEIDALKENVEELNSKLTAALSRNRELETKITDVNILKDEKDAEISELANLLDQAKMQTVQLSKDHSTLKSTTDDIISGLKVELGEMKEQRNMITEEKKSLESAINMISQNSEVKDKEAQEYSFQIKTLKKEIEILKSDISAGEGSKAESDNAIQELTTKISEGEIKLQDVQTELDSLKKLSNDQEKSLKSSVSKLEDEKVSLSTKIVQLEGEICGLNSELDKKVKEVEKERELVTGNSESIIKEYSEKISKMEGELKSMEQSKNDKIEELEASKCELIGSNNDLKSQLDDSVRSLAALNSSIDDLKIKLVTTEESEAKFKDLAKAIGTTLNSTKKDINSKDALLGEKSALINDLESQIKTLEETITSYTTKVDDLNKIAQLSTQASKEKDRLLEDKSETITKLELDLSDLSGTLNELKTSHESEKTKLLESHESEIKSKEVSHSEKAKEIESLTVQIGELSQKADELREKHEAEVASKEKELITMSESLTSLEREVKALNRELETETSSKTKEIIAIESSKSELQQRLEAEIAAKDEELSTTAELMNKLKTDIKDLNAKLESESASKLDAKIKGMVPKSDLEDMMLLMSELDEKNRKLKTKLKELGEEVSSDEDEDDDEDDDDDDENEDDEE